MLQKQSRNLDVACRTHKHNPVVSSYHREPENIENVFQVEQLVYSFLRDCQLNGSWQVTQSLPTAAASDRCLAGWHGATAAWTDGLQGNTAQIHVLCDNVVNSRLNLIETL